MTTEIANQPGIFRRWESLRLIYNFVLCGLIIGFTELSNQSWTNSSFAWIVLQTWLIANLFYCLGPLIERTADDAGVASVWLTTVLFWAILFLGSFSTVLSLFLFTLRGAF